MSPFVNTTTADEAEPRNYDGPINLYEAKANFEYDPDLLVNKHNYKCNSFFALF